MQTEHSDHRISWSVAPGGLVRAIHHGATPLVFAPYASSVRGVKRRPQNPRWYGAAQCRTARSS
jgi:hypothetical protein